ncbi:Protein spaetzle [Pseudolycoriella hygida]|uniref:Protein spaetzle n=1 Tax=Pseudolycoriella hygida TaxID=35572 RepID=A0A9Q0MTS6_9DIPT|nr:Protein spaetzle [Pseudolycoriella hygida]
MYVKEVEGSDKGLGAQDVLVMNSPFIFLALLLEIIATPSGRNETQKSGQPGRLATGRDSDADKIQFPIEQQFIPPPCAKESTVCELIDNYPTAHVDQVLKKSAHKYEDLFGSDVVITDIANRNNGIDEETLCSSQERLIYPQAGLTKLNNWMYIVNQKNYTQGVRVEECTHTNQCEMALSFPLGYESKCKQKYIYRQLLAINEYGDTVKDLFQLPSCCQCVLIRSDRNKRSIN